MDNKEGWKKTALILFVLLMGYAWAFGNYDLMGNWFIGLLTGGLIVVISINA